MGKREELEGYVIDQACLRKYPQDEMVSRAKEHTRECALMGHCVESGYGLVSEDGKTAHLEPGSTPDVVDVIRRSARQAEVRLRATREMEEGHMRTVSIEEG